MRIYVGDRRARTPVSLGQKRKSALLLPACAGFFRLRPWLKQRSALTALDSNKPPLACDGDSVLVPAMNMGPVSSPWHNPCSTSYSFARGANLYCIPRSLCCVPGLELNQPPTESAVGQSPTGKSVRCLTDAWDDCADNHNITSCLGKKGPPYVSREANRGDEKAGT